MKLKGFEKYEAIIFDLNGTMIDDMAYHIKGWHAILTSLGANLTLEKMKEECYGKNEELLERIFPGRFTDEEKSEMIMEKEKQYQQAFRPHLALIEGLGTFMQAAKEAKLKMAIGSAAIMFNINFVLDGLHIRHYIDAIVSADHVATSKPDPETFLKCAEALQVAPAKCIVFEDSPKGIECAYNAGMDSIAITTMHTADEFSAYSNVVDVISNFNKYQ